MTAETLRNRTLKDLAQMAKKRGVTGWHSMRKAQLVRALLKATKSSPARKSPKSPARKSPAGTRSARKAKPAKSVSRRKSPTKSAPARRSSTPAVARKPATPKKKTPAVARRLQAAKAKSDRMKNLSNETSRPRNGKAAKDRLVVMVRDPYWLQAYWDLTRQSVARAQAAMGQDWHTARPVLRVVTVSGGGTTSTTESLLQTIDIHGGVNNWYVHVDDPPKSLRLDIGYQSSGGRFHLLARSNIVHTPKAGASDSIDENWTDVAENFDKIYAMSGGYDENGSAGDLQELFEERLRRPMGSPMTTRYAVGVGGLKKRDFSFEVDAELIVYGTTEPDARVTLHGEPVRVRGDGTFTMRFSMPNCRQVIPAVASSADGVEQRTIVLAVERNTKTMEPVLRDTVE